MAMNPGTPASQTLSLNMKLISNNDLGGFGGIGEGMGMSKTADGRRTKARQRTLPVSMSPIRPTPK